jgi:hypothetical protein
VSYLFLWHYLCQAKFVTSKTSIIFSVPEPGLDDSDEALLLTLIEQRFASVRQLARLAHLSRCIVYRLLSQTLGFHLPHLRWVFHGLSDSQKLNRVQSSEEVLSIRESQKRRAWCTIVTFDKSLFGFWTNHELIWLRPGEGVPNREWKAALWTCFGFE